MSNWLDFNGDGKVDAGEGYMGYQVYKDVTDFKPSSSGTRRSGRLDGFDIFLIIVFAYWILNTVCGWLY